MERTIAIDFGTTTSAVFWRDHEGKHTKSNGFVKFNGEKYDFINRQLRQFYI